MPEQPTIDLEALLTTAQRWADKRHPKPKYHPAQIGLAVMTMAAIGIQVFVSFARLPAERYELTVFWAAFFCGAVPALFNWYLLWRNERFASRTYLRLLREAQEQHGIKS